MQAHRSFKKKNKQIFHWHNFDMNFDIHPVYEFLIIAINHVKIQINKLFREKSLGI